MDGGTARQDPTGRRRVGLWCDVEGVARLWRAWWCGRDGEGVARWGGRSRGRSVRSRARPGARAPVRPGNGRSGQRRDHRGSRLGPRHRATATSLAEVGDADGGSAQALGRGFPLGRGHGEQVHETAWDPTAGAGTVEPGAVAVPPLGQPDHLATIGGDHFSGPHAPEAHRGGPPGAWDRARRGGRDPGDPRPAEGRRPGVSQPFEGPADIVPPQRIRQPAARRRSTPGPRRSPAPPHHRICAGPPRSRPPQPWPGRPPTPAGSSPAPRPVPSPGRLPRRAAPGGRRLRGQASCNARRTPGPLLDHSIHAAPGHAAIPDPVGQASQAAHGGIEQPVPR